MHRKAYRSNILDVSRNLLLQTGEIVHILLLLFLLLLLLRIPALILNKNQLAHKLIHRGRDVLEPSSCTTELWGEGNERISNNFINDEEQKNRNSDSNIRERALGFDG